MCVHPTLSVASCVRLGMAASANHLAGGASFLCKIGMDHITIEDALRMKAQNRDRLIEDDLRQYLALCDRLQVENARIPYSFIRRLLQELAQLRHRRKIDNFQALLDNVTITIEKIEEEKGSSVVTIIVAIFVHMSLMTVSSLPHAQAPYFWTGRTGRCCSMPSSDETAPGSDQVRQEVHTNSAHCH